MSPGVYGAGQHTQGDDPRPSPYKTPKCLQVSAVVCRLSACTERDNDVINGALTRWCGGRSLSTAFLWRGVRRPLTASWWCVSEKCGTLCYSYNNYMADSSVRARLVARRLGESALYADRVAHKLRARGSATKVERDDFCNMEMFSKIWGLQSKVGQVYLFLSNKGADSQRKREAAQQVPNPTRPPVRQSMRRVFRL